MTTSMDFQRTLDQAVELLRPFLVEGDVSERVESLNAVRSALSKLGPFVDEPVDCLRWVPADLVEANDYNPNAVAPPEMALLQLSIEADGYTQPIVTHQDADRWTVIDGFHRNRVGKECQSVRERIFGYLPVVQIKKCRTGEPDRMATTIRHNRARGKHLIDGMAQIVLALKRRNWSDKKIGKELGMDPDEVLRLAQITGLAEAFKDRGFSLAWEAEIAVEEDDDLEEVCGNDNDSPTLSGKTTLPDSTISTDEEG